AQRFGQAARDLRVDLPALAEERPQALERGGHSAAEQSENQDRDDGEPQFRYISTHSAMLAVRIEPVSCTRPVPTRFLMPSASVMMREIRIPVLVESKYRMGRRMTCASTSLRISVMARCAATPSTCEFMNEVTAL